ncbi:hypothetical protein FAM09_25660 [Niastella caeni]|uniref:O-antigen ligase family protein n=1 Tax=Niastella caeni TaxID=2569763 RepID=A0A4S8HEN8_9BACT|nr:hypothetical protein [Niastella caeni]THU33538.1 hypothetical protein FAM09_25660 [Niastella caeni]
MRINKYFPVAFIYFFINSLGLPFGLTYTALLSPLLYIWVVVTRRQEVLWPFLLALTPFVLIHISIGVDTKSYFISILNITMVYVFCQAVYTFLIKCEHPENIFKPLLIINFIFCLVAIPLFFTPYDNLLWMKQFLTTGVEDFRRLSLLTYEPSYYALLFTPLFFFFLLQLIFYRNTINGWLLLVMLVLPLTLSFSLGVISAIVVALAVTFIVYIKTFIVNKRVINLLGFVGIIVITAIGIAIVFFPDNILFVRIANVITGKDPSGKGRTFEAFWLAEQLLEKKSYWWGIGPGQIKVLGFELIRDFYGYGYETTRVAIPNAAAETLALFGWVGFIVRILTECFFFVYTRVWRNYYRLLLFIFIFVYQFTGSFITNIAEYVIWIMAFTPVFREFESGKRDTFSPLHNAV